MHYMHFHRINFFLILCILFFALKKKTLFLEERHRLNQIAGKDHDTKNVRNLCSSGRLAEVEPLLIILLHAPRGLLEWYPSPHLLPALPLFLLWAHICCVLSSYGVLAPHHHQCRGYSHLFSINILPSVPRIFAIHFVTLYTSFVFLEIH